MIGLLALILLPLWIWIGVKISISIARFMVNKWRWRRGPAGVVALLLVFVGPFADELIGFVQFKYLNSRYGLASVDFSVAAGKRLKIVGSNEDKTVRWMMLPTRSLEFKYLDVDDGNIVLRHQTYLVSGGWVARYTPVGMDLGGPLFFTASNYDTNLQRDLYSRYSIVEIR